MNRAALANEVADLLELPKPCENDLRYEANRIVNAVFTAIIGGVLRGERVTIKGLGRFEIKTMVNTKPKSFHLFGKTPDGKPVIGMVKGMQKPRRYMKFTPSKLLLRTL